MKVGTLYVFVSFESRDGDIEEEIFFREDILVFESIDYDVYIYIGGCIMENRRNIGVIFTPLRRFVFVEIKV